MIDCPACGYRTLPGGRFCTHCGSYLLGSAPTLTTVAPVKSAPYDGRLHEPEAAEVAGLPPGNALLVVRNHEPGNRFLLDDDVVRVGRHPDSDIFLDDITVSRQHAELRRGGAGWTVADQGRLNGTYVNRDRVDMAALHYGDEIQIGKYRLLFFAGGAAADPMRSSCGP